MLNKEWCDHIFTQKVKTNNWWIRNGYSKIALWKVEQHYTNCLYISCVTFVNLTNVIVGKISQTLLNVIWFWNMSSANRTLLSFDIYSMQNIQLVSLFDCMLRKLHFALPWISDREDNWGKFHGGGSHYLLLYVTHLKGN